jgi:hypothetical protein
MRKTFHTAFVAAALLALCEARAELAASVGIPTMITRTSATLQVTLVDTGVVTLFWGTNNATTNAAAWANTNVVGTLASTNASTNITGLAAGVTYWYSALATNAVSTNWASPLYWTTLPASTTSAYKQVWNRGDSVTNAVDETARAMGSVSNNLLADGSVTAQVLRVASGVILTNSASAAVITGSGQPEGLAISDGDWTSAGSAAATFKSGNATLAAGSAGVLSLSSGSDSKLTYESGSWLFNAPASFQAPIDMGGYGPTNIGPADSYIVPTILTSAPTVTITRANGNMCQLNVTNSPCVLTFSASDWSDSGMGMVGLSLYVGTNTVTLTNSLVSFATAPTISTNTRNKLVFIKDVGTNTWAGRQ